MPNRYPTAKAKIAAATKAKPKPAKPKPRALLGVHPLPEDGWSLAGCIYQPADETCWRVYTRPSLAVGDSPWLSVKIACEGEAEPVGNYVAAWDGSRMPFGVRADKFREERPGLVYDVIRLLGGNPAAALAAAAAAKTVYEKNKAEVIAAAMAREQG